MMNDLWVESYRPKTVEECILPPHLKDTFKEIVATGEIPNMLFTGTSGLGKTTVARAICNELGLDYILINASENGKHRHSPWQNQTVRLIHIPVGWIQSGHP